LHCHDATLVTVAGRALLFVGCKAEAYDDAGELETGQLRFVSPPLGGPRLVARLGELFVFHDVRRHRPEHIALQRTACGSGNFKAHNGVAPPHYRTGCSALTRGGYVDQQVWRTSVLRQTTALGGLVSLDTWEYKVGLQTEEHSGGEHDELADHRRNHHRGGYRHCCGIRPPH
jgi:hypothetical protein